MTELYYNASNLIVSNGFVRNPSRYYLEEYFSKRPALNAELNSPFSNANATDLDGVTTIRIAEKVANKDFEVLGVNMTTALVTFPDDENSCGINLKTGTSVNDQAILLPHLVTNQTAWSGCKWNTSKEVEWDCAIKTSDNIVNICIWAGLKLTNTPTIATNDDQAYFIFATDNNDNLATLTTNANLHFVYSKADKDYITDLGLKVEVSTLYRLKIKMDSSNKVSIFVNEAQYGVFNTHARAGDTVADTTQKSQELTSVNLIPYIGVQTLTGAAKNIDVCYEKISRVL
jgi:hypothetical protein